MLDIRTPVAAWILARLYNARAPLNSRSLARQLCQASFDSMTNDNEYEETIAALQKEFYIAVETEMTQEVIGPGRPVAGLVITDRGIIAFRRQIGTPIEKIIPNIGEATPSSLSKFKEIIDTLKSTTDLMDSISNLCVKNAPLVLLFIQTMTIELDRIGIKIAT